MTYDTGTYGKTSAGCQEVIKAFKEACRKLAWQADCTYHAILVQHPADATKSAPMLHRHLLKENSVLGRLTQTWCACSAAILLWD